MNGNFFAGQRFLGRKELIVQRREFLKSSAAGLAVTATGLWVAGQLTSSAVASESSPTSSKLTPPASGNIPVAFAISEYVQVIDFAGPWEVFQDVMLKDGHASQGMDHHMPFDLYTVAETMEPVTATGGLRILPNYTFATAPSPKIVVVPAQRGSDALHAWLKKLAASPDTDLVTSVCTGAFQLAAAGILSGKSATTHHQALKALKEQYPDIDVKSGLRFVETGKIDTAGGLTSGVDMALRVVDRYYGRKVAQETADYMEYQSKGWIA
jgi:transcriptional regulator GlxA family with amidase domain